MGFNGGMAKKEHERIALHDNGHEMTMQGIRLRRSASSKRVFSSRSSPEFQISNRGMTMQGTHLRSASSNRTQRPSSCLIHET